MTGELRRPDQDAVLPAADAARMRQALAACSRLMTWAGKHYGPRFAEAAQDAAEAAGLGRAPGALAYEVSLAIDILDFSDAAGKTS
jgi:hypothetical protein